MARDQQSKQCEDDRHSENRVDFQELVQIIGYQLTAYIASTDIRTVERWLGEGLPEEIKARMQAALDIAKPIEHVESELVAQGFLADEMRGIEPYLCAAEMLRSADVRTARAVLGERVSKEFLENVAGDLEAVELRLKQCISQAIMPPGTAYSVHLSLDRNRLSIQLIHTGFSLDQQLKWDRGQEWPCWEELIRNVPEITAARTVPDLQTGFPFKYLRRASGGATRA